MSNIYDALVYAFREHVKTHGNARPLHFELKQDSFDALIDARQAIISRTNSSLPRGWEALFHGVPVLVVEEGNYMVDKDGSRVPLAL